MGSFSGDIVYYLLQCFALYMGLIYMCMMIMLFKETCAYIMNKYSKAREIVV